MDLFLLNIFVVFVTVGTCSTERKNFKDLCESLRTDDSLFTMFRLNPEPIQCPFNGAPYTFTYNRGEKECKSPVSYAESCTDPSKLLLKYQACPDIEDSESTSKIFFLLFFSMVNNYRE